MVNFIVFINSTLLLVAGALVAFSTNPINSAVFLIATFVSAAFLLFFLSVDFLSLVFIVVYVGAIAVLFLFVVMMLAIKERETNLLSVISLQKLLKKTVLGFLFLITLLVGLEKIFSLDDFFLTIRNNNFFVDNFDGLTWFGQFFYNNFDTSFLIAGLILLVALMGAILLTHNFVVELKKQKYVGQLSASSNIALKFGFFMTTFLKKII